MIRLDQDLDLLIALQVDKAVPAGRGPGSVSALTPAAAAAAAKSAARHPGEAAPAATPAASATPAALTHQAPSNAARPIDDSDPYAK